MRSDPSGSIVRLTDPSIVAIVNGKGGTGKTMLALGLCAHTARSNGRALAVDVDPQASTYRTTQLLEDPGYEVVHEVDPSVLQDLKAVRDFDMIFVDCPGSLEGRDVLDEVLKWTDYVLIPFDGDLLTEDPVLKTAAYVTQRGVPYKVVLGNVDPQRGASFVLKSWQWLEDHKLNHMRTMVRRYRAWSLALEEGVPITRYRGRHGADAREDLTAVHTELLLELGRARGTGHGR